MQIFSGGLIYVNNNVLDKTGVSPSTEKQDAIFIDDKPPVICINRSRCMCSAIPSSTPAHRCSQFHEYSGARSKFYNNFIIARQRFWTASKGDKTSISPSVISGYHEQRMHTGSQCRNFRNYTARVSASLQRWFSGDRQRAGSSVVVRCTGAE